MAWLTSGPEHTCCSKFDVKYYPSLFLDAPAAVERRIADANAPRPFELTLYVSDAAAPHRVHSCLGSLLVTGPSLLRSIASLPKGPVAE